jgi:hypothetical protein
MILARIFGFTITATILSGCGIGMLLFYKDSRSEVIYRGSTSNACNFVIRVVNLSHCGCSNLHVDIYKGKARTASISYNGRLARKTVYIKNSGKGAYANELLLATSSDSFNVAFDAVDSIVFKEINNISDNPPKSIYPIKRTNFKGYYIDWARAM